MCLSYIWKRVELFQIEHRYWSCVLLVFFYNWKLMGIINGNSHWFLWKVNYTCWIFFYMNTTAIRYNLIHMQTYENITQQRISAIMFYIYRTSMNTFPSVQWCIECNSVFPSKCRKLYIMIVWQYNSINLFMLLY